VAVASNLRITLASDDELLKEVVVVAYGTASRASITGAVSVVDAKKIEKRPVTNAASALEGAAAGVQVNNTYGEPGSSPSIRIRGFGSVNGSNAPLIVVDGVPYEGSLTDIASSDIESMSILKDASSAALYGNKAANGVVLVTTKKGKSSKLNVRLHVNQGIYNRGVSEYERMGINDWMETQWDGYQRYYMVDKGQDAATAAVSSTNTLVQDVLKINIFDKANDALFDANGKFVGNVLPGYTDLDWNKELERNGYRQEYGISTDVANEKYDIFSSISYLDEKGYILSSDYNRLSARLRANFTPTTWFKTGVNVSASTQKSNYANSAEGTFYVNPFYAARMMAPIYPIYQHDSDGNIVKNSDGEKQYNLGELYLSNRHVIYELKNDVNSTYTNTINAQAYATIDFLNDFSFTVKGNTSLRDESQKNYNNPLVGDGAGNNGRLYRYFVRNHTYSVAQELFWSRSFESEHNLEALLAHEAYEHGYSYEYTSKANQKLSGSNTELSNFSEIVSSAGYTNKYRTESYLGRVRYNFQEKYYFDASFRRDGSSRFHKDNRWGNFWSIGGSWMVTEEDFMKSYDWLDYLKLRASYGEVGNDIGVGYYAYKALYLSNQNAGLGAYYKQQNEAKDLKWETSSTFDVAIEGRLLRKINFSLGYFDKRSNDLLFSVNNPLSVGANSISGSSATGMSTVSKNIGSVSNKGLEFSFDIDAFKNKDWSWNIGANLTYMKNKIIKLPDGEDILNGIQMFSEGKSIYEFYTYKYAGVDQMTGRAIYNADPEKVTDANLAAGNVLDINGKYYANDITYAGKEWCGSALADVLGGISTSLTYKSVTLSALGTYSIGGKVYDSTYQSLMTMSINGVSSLHKDMKDAWTGVPEGMTETSSNRIDANGVPRADLSSQGSLSTSASSRWLKNGSYFVLKNINLNYSFPKNITNKLGIDGLDVYGTIENAFTLTHLKGMNPQYSFRGTIDNTFVTARVFSLGLSIKL
ncbi:SusC/RagA family TonB-linked outer membrane protein, partial [Bacteroidales bacterium OttesenSCG-928-J19]|nr:SusC/RagA family TonB-linked outer membrane protein [Bacteroidales bacterium OttesenSCG-928-J19]